MKVITLWEPWAILVAIQAKKFETRSWQTPYRGPLAIHASKTFPTQARALCAQSPFKEALAGAGYHSWRMLPLGQIVAITDLRQIFRVEAVRGRLGPDELAYGDYSDGRFAWQLENIQKMDKPLSARGKQGLWFLPDELLGREAGEVIDSRQTTFDL